MFSVARTLASHLDKRDSDDDAMEEEKEGTTTKAFELLYRGKVSLIMRMLRTLYVGKGDYIVFDIDGTLLKDNMSRLEQVWSTFRVFLKKRCVIHIVTARPESSRGFTKRQLNKAGYGGWAKLWMLPDDTRKETFEQSVQSFKHSARAAIAELAKSQGKILRACIGDRLHDILKTRLLKERGGDSDALFYRHNDRWLIKLPYADDDIVDSCHFHGLGDDFEDELSPNDL